MITSLAQIMVSQWIWSVIYGIYHPIINCMFMIPLIMYLVHRKFLPSLIYALSSQGFAMMVFGIIAHLLLDYLGGPSIDTPDSFMALRPFASALLLGMVYALLQLLFFYLTRLMWHIPLKTFAIIVLLSNFLTAVLIFRFVPGA